MARRRCTERRRVNGSGFRKLTFTGGLTRLGGELLEAGRHCDLEGPQRFVPENLEGVDRSNRQKYVVAGARVEGFAIALESREPGNDVEALVFGDMAVQGRREAGGVDEFDDGQLASGLLAGNLDGGQAAEEPVGRAVVAAASVSRIADVAGVARPTVTAVFGSKPALMKVLVDEALAGDDEPVPVRERPWFQPVWDARSLEDLAEAYAGVCTLIGARTALIFEALGRAADSSEELAALWKTINGNRRSGAAMVVRHGLSSGALDPKTDVEGCIDALWIHNDPALYRALVLTCGWTEESYKRWLTRQMKTSLAEPLNGDQPSAAVDRSAGQ